uniref:FYVE-type domain-containing protein n=1 Tax=Rhabditophanes sp. KR3021 TaxID=114890 RepID=A0AC35TXH5_9BILA
MLRSCMGKTYIGVTLETAKIVVKWMYTDEVENDLSVEQFMELLLVSNQFALIVLKEFCESALMARLDTDNCIKIYQFSQDSNLDKLKKHCIQLMNERWDDFLPEHFVSLQPKLLFDLLKGHSTSVLASIIRLQRQDVLFLFLLENGNRLKEVINAFTEKNDLPLGLALNSRQFEMAKELVKNEANVNACYKDGKFLLFEAIEKDNIEGVEFLVANGVFLGAVQPETNFTLLHTFASSTKMTDNMVEWATSQINEMDFVNQLDNIGRTPLSIAMTKGNEPIIELLLKNDKCDVNIATIEKVTPLQICLFERKDMLRSKLLVDKGANVNFKDKNGESLLHLAVIKMDLIVMKFLIDNGADINSKNSDSLTPLHLLISRKDQFDFKVVSGALNLLVTETANLFIQDDVNGNTVLHLAVSDVRILESFEGNNLPLAVKNFHGETPLAVALKNCHFDCGKWLVKSGADIDEKDTEHRTLFIQALESKNEEMAMFLLQNKASLVAVNKDELTCLEIAVDNNLSNVVEAMCHVGIKINSLNATTGLSPLWRALEREHMEVAEILVNHGCDQSLLHRAIDNNNVCAAKFLINKNADVNALKKYYDSANDDKQNSLHMAIAYGLTDISLMLIANPDMKYGAPDGDGKTPAHLAIQEEDTEILRILLSTHDVSFLNARDKLGMTPLALAMKRKNVFAAKEIVNRLPHAAVQVNGNGENLLHVAVKNDDFESVLFLLSLQIDVNIVTQDKFKFTALHLASQIGSEMIIRNLLLAGARINTVNSKGLTSIHIAAFHGHALALQILISNEAECNIVDIESNSALHSAVIGESEEAFKVLLMESQINPYIQNIFGQSCLHLMTGISSKTSTTMFNCLIQNFPDFPLEAADGDGNTAFLLAYHHGNGELCRALIKQNVCIAITNAHGMSIFSIETPTKQLLYGLLDNLKSEPKWSEGDNCSDCKTKFTLTMRKHHCRHCGRLVCSKCGDQTMPLIKYGIQKPVRICKICQDALVNGVPRN